MRKEKYMRIKMMVVLLLAVLMLVGVNVQTSQAAGINNKKITLIKNKAYQLKVSTKKKVKWSSSNSKVAKVSNDGIVTGMKKGKAVVTGKINGKKYTCKVSVQNQYTTKQLYNMLYKYISIIYDDPQKLHYGIVEETPTTIQFWVYEDFPERVYSVGWFTINKKTGKGTDDTRLKKIDFSKYSSLACDKKPAKATKKKKKSNKITIYFVFSSDVTRFEKKNNRLYVESKTYFQSRAYKKGAVCLQGVGQSSKMKLSYKVSKDCKWRVASQFSKDEEWIETEKTSYEIMKNKYETLWKPEIEFGTVLYKIYIKNGAVIRVDETWS